MSKLKKLDTFRQNPNEAWEQIQLARTKINEIISVINDEDEISGLTYDEDMINLEKAIKIAVLNNNFELVGILSAELSELKKETE